MHAPRATKYSATAFSSATVSFWAVALLAAFCVLATGCGLKQEAQWRNAPNAQQFFSNAASNSALVDNDITELSLACKDMLEPAREALDNPGSPGLRVMIQVCSQEGLGFGGDLRCKDDTLQLSCL